MESSKESKFSSYFFQFSYFNDIIKHRVLVVRVEKLCTTNGVKKLKTTAAFSARLYSSQLKKSFICLSLTVCYKTIRHFHIHIQWMRAILYYIILIPYRYQYTKDKKNLRLLQKYNKLSNWINFCTSDLSSRFTQFSFFALSVVL